MKHAAYVLALILTLIATFASSATAEVIRITMVTRQPWNSGQPFGAVGPYEQIKGIAIGEIDPADPRNAVITDIDLAPRNARGMVEYRTTFTIRKPLDMSHAPGVLLYDIVNRGGPRAPSTWGVRGDPGDGFLYNMGHVLLWSGWQGDMPISTADAGKESMCLWRRTATGRR